MKKNIEELEEEVLEEDVEIKDLIKEIEKLFKKIPHTKDYDQREFIGKTIATKAQTMINLLNGEKTDEEEIIEDIHNILKKFPDEMGILSEMNGELEKLETEEETLYNFFCAQATQIKYQALQYVKMGCEPLGRFSDVFKNHMKLVEDFKKGFSKIRK